MKKFIALFCISLCISFNAEASYVDEMEELGTMAGIGLACKASKFETFEMISAAILRAKATSQKQENKGIIAYNTAKANSYTKQINSKLMPCNEVKSRFDNQQIFETVIYKNGTVTTPDGKTISPRIAYDVSTNNSKTYHINQPKLPKKTAPAIGHISR